MTKTNNAGKARAIAFYLPQFHPIPENDEWWGKGFTEWTNVVKAKPLFRGHYQPHVPADLGFYDLRVPDVRIAQADMARTAGIEAFCYWHYWFAGDRLLERPFDEVLQSGRPEFPFCLAWANETWSGIWHGLEKKILMEQTYPGDEDHRRHFDYVSKAFADPRYVRVDGRPMFLFYRPRKVPEPQRTLDLWRRMAEERGFPGLHLVAIDADPNWNAAELGYDAVVLSSATPMSWFGWDMPMKKISQHLRWKSPLSPVLKKVMQRPRHVYPYNEAVARLPLRANGSWESYPCVLPNWDNTPRSGLRGYVLHGSNPEYFRTHLRKALTEIEPITSERRILFIKSWNEWAEGNHLEPDLHFGHGYLQVLAEELLRK